MPRYHVGYYRFYGWNVTRKVDDLQEAVKIAEDLDESLDHGDNGVTYIYDTETQTSARFSYDGELKWKEADSRQTGIPIKHLCDRCRNKESVFEVIHYTSKEFMCKKCKEEYQGNISQVALPEEMRTVYKEIE